MLDDETPAKIRAATADHIGYVHGMLITFEEPLHGLSEHDLLGVTAPDGSLTNLQGVEMQGDTLVVAATVSPSTTLHFKLVPVNDRIRRLEMEDHHVESQKRGWRS
jgi:hypothetical protein